VQADLETEDVATVLGHLNLAAHLPRLGLTEARRMSKGYRGEQGAEGGEAPE
jgi:hypothetical protein